MRRFLQRKGYSALSVHFGGWGAKNRNLLSGTESTCIAFQTPWAEILHLPTISTAGKFTCSLYLQNLVDGEAGIRVCHLHLESKLDTLCATQKNKEKKTAFWPGFGSYQAVPLYFHCVWLAPGKEIQRKHLRNIVIQPQLCLHRKKTAWGFSFSLSLLRHCVFLFGNKWNWKVSRCFATITQYFPPPTHPQPEKRLSLIFQPEPLTFPRRSLSS